MPRGVRVKRHDFPPSKIVVDLVVGRRTCGLFEKRRRIQIDISKRRVSRVGHRGNAGVLKPPHLRNRPSWLRSSIFYCCEPRLGVGFYSN